ncbi:MAG: glyceraldehyde-3-phosphate dehydrogenase, partial [Nanoarchaeota archaeon]|nr:glyceraldehyde-3-phosphate dehydrogenase [Nanoarchaeota archaeon]
MDKIKVGVVGYGTIGKRVADAVMLQDDMELVGVTAHSYNYRMITAKLKKIPMYRMADAEDLDGLEMAGTFDDMLKQVDVVIDCSPKKVASDNIEKFYKAAKIKAIVQGGEKPKTTEAS